MVGLQRFFAAALCLMLLISQTAVGANFPALKTKSGRASARVDTITGTLEGLVLDNNRAPFAGVRIIVTNQDTGNQRATLTNNQGRYQITFLPLGIYSIDASKEGYVIIKPTNGPVKTALNKTVNTAPEIVMGPATVAGAPVTPTPGNPTPPAASGTTPAPAQTGRDEVGQLTNTGDATRRGNADERMVSMIPLSGVRTFDDLAFLAAGVAPPPQVRGVAGPGIGAGIGTAGQFSVNGQRARSNNFTVDGSDNNDEDVGVRRQGFVSLVPQSIESIKEFQVVTQLTDAEQGRNVGSQVNAVSRSGGNFVHGTIYDFFNHSALNARDFFDYTSDKSASYALRADARVGNTVTRVPVTVNGVPQVFANPSENKDPFQRNQGGAAIGFPLKKDKTFFFGSFERQDIKARQETHFAVPTVEQRGFLGFGATGFVVGPSSGYGNTFNPTFTAGDAVFSLFPFANNPVGPYGANTFTQVLPADARGTILSAKFDHSFTLMDERISNVLTGRYNFTDDTKQIPAVGEALFSGLQPQVRTQNVSLFLNSQLTNTLANQLRGSYGRTALSFDAVRNPLTIPSRAFPNDPFLINRPGLFNVSRPDDPKTFGSYIADTRGVEGSLGPIGQLTMLPFSSVGLDVYLFPQARVNNTIQMADTLTWFRGNHNFKFGADIRRTQLNSFLNRNFRPQVVFGGSIDQSNLFNSPTPNLSRSGPTPGFFSGADLAALGIPTGIFQTLSPTGNPDSTIGLRFWQYNVFFNDNWKFRPGLVIDYGLRYELNTVPREQNNRIEKTFALNQLPANDSNLGLAVGIPGANGQLALRALNSTALLNSFNSTIGALNRFLDGRTAIFDEDRNNIAPHLSFAWDPFVNSTTQAGRNVIRGGFGMAYDVALGSVVSQSRNVFPTFLPINLDANTFSFIANDPTVQFFVPGETGFFSIFNPIFVPIYPFDRSTGLANRQGLLQGGALNTLNVPAGLQQQLFGLLFNPTLANPSNPTQGASSLTVQPSGSGLAFTLPVKKFKSPYAMHYNLQYERQIANDYLLNVAYVGSRGVNLTRFRTPNGGTNSPTFPVDPLGIAFPNTPPAVSLPPLSSTIQGVRAGRPIPELGAFSVFDSSASSTYHSMQVSLTKRFNQGNQFTAAYTWSHAIDDVSDVFDVAGAYTLPQDDRNLRAERGSANFDIRHRYVFSGIANFPGLDRFNMAGGAKQLFLGGWQLANFSTYQTGQPFTVNTILDINLDGNLTDRLNLSSGISTVDDGPKRLLVTSNPASPSAPFLARTGQNGAVGRNTYRANGVIRTDLALIKNFKVSETNSLVFRVEAFNLANRTHFAIPVRILEAPSFGNATTTSVSPRQIQFALKYVF